MLQNDYSGKVMSEKAGFKDLKVWQRGKKLAVRVYEIQERGDSKWITP